MLFLNCTDIVAASITTILAMSAVFALCISWTLDETTENKKLAEEFKKEELQTEINNLEYKKRSILQQINEQQNIETNKLKNGIEERNQILSKLDTKINDSKETLYTLRQDIDNIKSDTQQHLTQINYNTNTIGYPWLAELYADISYIEENKIADYLDTKEHPAHGTANEIRNNLSKEKKILQTQLKIAQNQLRYYESIFPWLEEFKEADPIEAYETLNSLCSDDEYTRVKNYLSPEEFQKLSTAEKYQLALDRWKTKNNKTPWQIGIDYERYIGYVYERKGYNVIYNGALEGLEDMGRDIVAENKDEILVIQCKYWKQEKTIHEKHIFQLYGTVILKKLETKKKVKGVFITSAKLSPLAKTVAKELKIEIKEAIAFDKDYPCIKCNKNRTTGEKIYHLPFDQQYDRVIIEPNKGECYVRTTHEAEDKGFRHAHKHFNN
jgi:hypothetical protein